AEYDAGSTTANLIFAQPTFNGGACNQGNASPSVTTLCTPYAVAQPLRSGSFFETKQYPHRNVDLRFGNVADRITVGGYVAAHALRRGESRRRHHAAEVEPVPVVGEPVRARPEHEIREALAKWRRGRQVQRDDRAAV